MRNILVVSALSLFTASQVMAAQIYFSCSSARGDVKVHSTPYKPELQFAIDVIKVNAEFTQDSSDYDVEFIQQSAFDVVSSMSRGGLAAPQEMVTEHALAKVEIKRKNGQPIYNGMAFDGPLVDKISTWMLCERITYVDPAR